MTLTCTTPTGKTFTVELRRYLPGVPVLWVQLPELGIQGQCAGPIPLKTPRQGCTHYLDVSKAIGIDQATAQRIGEALAAYKAAWQASPEGQLAAPCLAEHLLADVDPGRWQRAVVHWAAGTYAITVTAQSAYELRARVTTGAGTTYIVLLRSDHSECDCKDSVYRSGACKHALAVALHVLRPLAVSREPSA